MRTYERVTPEQVLADSPPQNEYQSNNCKTWREAYVVAKLCTFFEFKGEITAPSTEPSDALLEVEDKKFYFQVTECKNEGPRGRPTDLPYEDRDGVILLNLHLSNISPADRIQERIDEKEKYAAGDKKDLVLLVYYNLSTHDDVDLESLAQENASSKFSDIVIWGSVEEWWGNPSAYFLKRGKFSEFCASRTEMPR